MTASHCAIMGGMIRRHRQRGVMAVAAAWRAATVVLVEGLVCVLVAGFVGGFVGGCAADPRDGYTAMSMWPDDVATVHVPIFENRTFERGVEFDLTEAVIKAMEARTPYRVAAINRADASLTGSIVNVERQLLSRSRATGLSEETVLSVTIDFEFKDLRTGRVLVRRQRFTGQGLFHPSPPAGEPVELGRAAAVQHLARDIVSELRASW